MKPVSLSAALLALFAGAASAQPATELSGAFDVEVEVSQRSGGEMLAQFRLRDAATREVIAEPAIAFATPGAGAFNVGASAASDCASGPVPGYCMDLVVGDGTREGNASYEAFVSRDGTLRLSKRNISLAQRR